MKIENVITFLEKLVPNPTVGLPDEVFYYISKTTPLVNVDLLIKDEHGRTLLSWRDDQFSGKGWHIPGGIVRLKETLETRVKKVAEMEIGVDNITFNPEPIALNQLIYHERDIRSHFISILYKCFITHAFIPDNRGLSNKDVGYLMWHDFGPDNLLKCHEIYRKYI